MNEDTEIATDTNVYEFRSWANVFLEAMLGNGRKPAAGIDVTPESALYSTGILACVRVLSESIASIPLNLYRRIPGGGKEIAEDHPLQEVLAYQPNSWMTSFEWREWMQSQMLLWGNAYSLIKPGKRGSVDQLIPMHASRMKVERLENGKLRYYYQEPGQSTPVPYRQEQILHLRWLSSDGVTGYVPVQLSQDAISLARAAEIYSSSFFGNGAQGGTSFKTTQPKKPEELRKFKEQWDEIHRGAASAFKTVVVPFGYEKDKELINNAANQLIETRRYQLEEQARIYRVPLQMLGDITNVRQSTSEQSGIEFVTFSLTPHCKRWQYAIRRDLITDDKNYFVEFDMSSLMVGDHAARAQFLREGFNMGALSVDEIRGAMGYNPLPEGQGAKRFVPVNMQLLEAFTPEAPQQTQSVAEDDGGESQSEGEDSDEPMDGNEGPAPATTPTTNRSAAEALFRTTLRRLAATEIAGILERRNKPAKLQAWLEACEQRMKTELSDAAMATNRDIDAFVLQWGQESRDRLLECHRSGSPYEEAEKSWMNRESLSDG